MLSNLNFNHLNVITVSLELTPLVLFKVNLHQNLYRSLQYHYKLVRSIYVLKILE
jgi:hypothetical protein